LRTLRSINSPPFNHFPSYEPTQSIIMKFSILALAAVVSLGTAQNLSGEPACAVCFFTFHHLYPLQYPA